MERETHILVIECSEQDKLNFDLDFVLIPKPHHYQIFDSNKGIIIDKNSVISCINLKDSRLLINRLNDALHELFNFTLKNVRTDELNENHFREIQKALLFDEKNEEAYSLTIVKNFIAIKSLSDKGVFYGIQTLIQIFKNIYVNSQLDVKHPLIVPYLEIKDKPDMEIRGVAQDISRGQVFTIENAKRYIRLLSHYKLNFYCLYIEDMFSHPKHPLIGKDRGALNCREIKELVKYAKKYYIELIPIFECLGHVDNILQHQKYRDLGEFPGAQCLDISNPDIYSFLTDYISEISKCFSTKFFHIGCDETFDLGQYNSKAYIEKNGKSQVLKEFYERVYNIVKDHGNEKVIMYDDIVRKDDFLLENLNKDIIMMYWNYSPKKKFKGLDELFNAGFKVIVSPSMLNWNRNFPDIDNSSKNIINLIDEAYEYNSEDYLGVLTSTWGDQRYFSLRENEIFGAILTGAKSWDVNSLRYSDFKRNYGYLFYGLNYVHLEKFNQLLSYMSDIVKLSYRFILLLPPLFYTDLFKHPFPDKKYKPANKKFEEMGKLANKALKICNELKQKINFEIKNFEYIEFGALLAKILGEKIQLSLEISQKLGKREISKQKRESIIQKLKIFSKKFKNLKEKYEILWLRAAKRPCLNENLRLFDQVIHAYEDKINQLLNNIYFKDPYLLSEWIWVDEKSCPKQPRYFRKMIDIEEPFSKVIIQATVLNHMKIYVNNELIGEVLGRMSLSRLPILFRVKKFDVTDKLKVGKNVIAIKAINYDGYKGALNLFGQLEYKNGRIKEFYSDSSWKCSKSFQKENSWKSVDYNDKKWDYVKSYGKPPNLNGELLKPNLLKGEISLTQDYFGAQGYFYNGLSIFMNKYLVKMFKFLIPFIVKRAKLFG